MNLRHWLLNLLSLCWWIAHPREAAQAIREAGDWAARTLAEMKRREHGFTLIELLIVLAILGIIAGVVMMGVGAANAGIGG